MKKTVLTYGLISGVIAAVLMLAHVPFMDGGSKALIVGYTGIVLSAVESFKKLYANPFVNVAFTSSSRSPSDCDDADFGRHSSSKMTPIRESAFL